MIENYLRMRSFHLIFCVLIAASQAMGQNITISGKALDKETGESLPFASISIKGKSESTVANLQGDFDFHLPTAFRNEILVISMLGYNNYEAPVWSVIESNVSNFALLRSTTLLDEVVVAESLKGGEIVKIAWTRIPKNFPMQPFLLDAFYRDVKRVGGTYISLLEAAVKIYDENYEAPRNTNKLRERVKLVEVRQSLGYDNKFNNYFGQENLLEDLLLHNNIRYRDDVELEEMLAYMHREQDTYFNGRKVFVVSLQDQDKLKLYIDKESYGILHLESEITVEGNKLAEKKGLISKYLHFKKIIDFRMYDGIMYLNFIQVITKERWYKPDTQELQFETELQQNLVVNRIECPTEQRIGSTERMRAYGLQYQDYPYNKSFWKNYNFLKETPLDAQIRKDLEKIAPLEKQFEN